MKKPKMTARQWWARQRRIMRRLIGMAERGELPANVALYRVHDAAESRIYPSRSKVWIYSRNPVVLPEQTVWSHLTLAPADEGPPPTLVLRGVLFSRYDGPIPSPGAGGGQW